MVWRLLADATVLAHLAFILFAIFGCLLVLRRPRWAWLHVPAVVWVVWLEITGALCPLTRFENMFRQRAGDAGYPEGFIDHYLLPVIYPAALTSAIQIAIGVTVLVFAIATYTVVFRRWRLRAKMARHAARPRRTIAAEDWR